MNDKTRNIVYGGVFAALMAVGAFIKIVLPVGPFLVTVSLQLFFAILAGFLLGARLGGFAVLSYLIIGLSGVPIFAHGGGPGYLLKPTFGFLIGFAAAAFVVGLLTGHFRKRDKRVFLLAALAGEGVYYLCGLAYYYLMANFFLSGVADIGIRELVLAWFLSTVLPDSAIALLSAELAWRVGPVFASAKVSASM